MKRILVADDDVLTCLSVGLTLLREGYQVIYAEDGNGAADLTHKRTPDVIICDLDIPGLDGYELHKLVRGNPRTQHTPIVFLTETTTLNSERVGANPGPVACLQKPFTRDQLIKTVRKNLLWKPLGFRRQSEPDEGQDRKMGFG